MMLLIGPGGAGKTTVGALLAERLGVSFVDLDRAFADRCGDISAYIDRCGHHAYGKQNVDTCRALLAESRDAGVIALSSGFMAYPHDIHPEYVRLRDRIEQNPTTFVLVPSLDLEICAAETVRRQLGRPFARSAAREEAVIRERFAIYVGLRARKIETMRPVSAIVEELVASSWFSELAASRELPDAAASALDTQGFAVLPGLLSAEQLRHLVDAYDAAFASASGDDVRIGSTSTKVNGILTRGRAFEELFVLPRLLDACCRVIGGPFKLSSFIGRSVRAGASNQGLHVDVTRASADWPLLGFIVMVDAFRPDNGATRFVPGSHLWMDTPDARMPDALAAHARQTLACGPAGSLLVFNGSVWHGHTANTSTAPRRSVQGAFIPRGGRAATDFAARVSSETHARLSPVARHVLGF